MPPVNDAFKVAVVIPALNESGTIASLVEAILTQPVAQVIVVDYASTDETATEARRAGARVVTEARRGFGYACFAGAAAAGAADVIVIMDGDGRSVPAEMPELLCPLLAGEAELVLGSRTLGHIVHGAMPPHQRFGNWLVSRMFRVVYGIHVTDLSAYRAIRRDLLQRLDMQQGPYAWSIEMVAKAAACHARIVEVPVSWLPRGAGRSKLSGTVMGTILGSYTVISVPLRYLFWRPDVSGASGED